MTPKVFPAKAAFVIANPKSKLPDQLREVMRVKHYSLRTEEAYGQWVRRYLKFHRNAVGGWRHPRDLGAADVVAFLNHLANVENVAAATQNQALNAISFLYTQVLGLELGDLGEHLGITPVTLAFGTGDGVELAGIGHQHGGPEASEKPANPRTMGAGFQGHGGTGEIRKQPGQSGAGVGQGIFTDNLAGGIEDADVMLMVTEIEAEGEPTDNSGRGFRNEGRSGFCFHKQTLPDASLRRAVCLLI